MGIDPSQLKEIKFGSQEQSQNEEIGLGNVEVDRVDRSVIGAVIGACDLGGKQSNQPKSPKRK